VLLISVDMLRADHLGSYGYGRETSPHMDRLAREGALFEECISSAPWTLPTHAALFTGLPDSVHGCTDSDRALAPGFTTLAERFRSGGYATAGFFSGPYLHPAFGLDQGFDTYVNCTSYARALDEAPVEDWAMDREVMHSSHRDVTSPAVAEEVSDWLARADAAEGDDPFFMFVHLWDVHFDFLPPAAYAERFAGEYEGTVSGEDFFFDPTIRAGMPAADLQHLLDLYDGEISWTDHHIGLILNALEERGLLDSTVIALTADHGTEFFEHGGKAHRMTLFEEVLRVPLILRYPPAIPADTRPHTLARTVDIAPTLLELADLAPLSPAGGRSLLATLGGGGASAAPIAAVSELFSVGSAMRSVRTQRWKFVDDMGRDTFAWYDLQADPCELHPSQDLEHPLGAQAKAGYLAAMAELERLYAARPAEPTASTVPESLDAHLRALGYVGEDAVSGEQDD
jgi:arylsulfatase A-like enzyme